MRRKFFCGVASVSEWRRGGASVSLKKGSRIFKQRAPNWTSRFFVGGSRGLLAAPNGAARKELGGKIKRRDEIPRNNFFGNEAVRSNFLRKMSNLLRRLLRGDFSRVNQGVYVIPHWFVPPAHSLSQKRILFALQGDFLLHQAFFFSSVSFLVNKVV